MAFAQSGKKYDLLRPRVKNLLTMYKNIGGFIDKGRFLW
jgi:hypothetical protein